MRIPSVFLPMDGTTHTFLKTPRSWIKYSVVGGLESMNMRMSRTLKNKWKSSRKRWITCIRVIEWICHNSEHCEGFENIDYALKYRVCLGNRRVRCSGSGKGIKFQNYFSLVVNRDEQGIS